MARREFAVAAPGRAPWLFLLGLWLLLMAVAFAQPHQQAPNNPVPWWLVIPFGTALPSVGMLVWLAVRHVAIDEGELQVAAGLSTLRIPVAELALDRAQVLDLEEHTGYLPALPLYALGLPGFRGGYYLLRNRRLAYCLVTDRTRVLLLPRRDGRFVLLSAEKPQALLEALSSKARVHPMRAPRAVTP